METGTVKHETFCEMGMGPDAPIGSDGLIEVEHPVKKIVNVVVAHANQITRKDFIKAFWILKSIC
jgi:hypothetical protein